LQGKHKYQRQLWTALDSVDHSKLLMLPCTIGLPDKIMGLMKELYTDTVSCVCMDGSLSNWFEFKLKVG